MNKEAVVKEKIKIDVVRRDAKVVQVDAIGPFTYAKVEFVDPIKDKRYFGYGQARQGFGDKWKAEIGQNIAISRAQKALAKKINGEPIHLACMG